MIKKISAIKGVHTNKSQLKYATARTDRIRTIERIFLFGLLKRNPNDMQLAMELEAARGHVAKAAFASVMIRHRIQAVPEEKLRPEVGSAGQ